MAPVIPDGADTNPFKIEGPDTVILLKEPVAPVIPLLNEIVPVDGNKILFVITALFITTLSNLPVIPAT